MLRAGGRSLPKVGRTGGSRPKNWLSHHREEEISCINCRAASPDLSSPNLFASDLKNKSRNGVISSSSSSVSSFASSCLFYDSTRRRPTRSLPVCLCLSLCSGRIHRRAAGILLSSAQLNSGSSLFLFLSLVTEEAKTERLRASSSSSSSSSSSPVE